MGIRFFAAAGSKMKGAWASDMPEDWPADWPGTWVGLEGERAMNAI
jgi:hypothetical protein